MKLTKEQLQRIIKEELEKVKDTTGFFSGPGFDKTKEEDELLGDKPRPFQQRIAKDKLRKEQQDVSHKDIQNKAAEIKSNFGGLGLDAKEAIEAVWSEYDEPSKEQRDYLNDKFPGYSDYALNKLYATLEGKDLAAGEEWSDWSPRDEGKQKMKLTKEDLQRIIKEELQSVMTEERTWKPGLYGIDDQGRLADGPFENIEDLRNHYTDSYGGDAGNEKVESGEWVYSLVHPNKKGDMSLEALEVGLRFLSRNDSAAAASIIGYLEDGLDLETAIEASDEKLSPKELAGLGIEQDLQEET